MQIRLAGSFVKHGHHLLFGLSLLCLAALTLWWSLFIHNSIIEKRQARYDLLLSEMKLLVKRLDNSPPQALSEGPLSFDRRFQIRPCSSTGGAMTIPLTHRPSLCLTPIASVIEEIENRTGRLKLMVYGESGMLALLLLISIFFLYSYIQSERRTLREVREFWERSAHEIKTPIAGLKAFLQNLKTRPEDLGEMSRYLDKALIQVGRQERLAENLLTGYSMDLGLSRLRPEPMDLTSFLGAYLEEEALHLVGAEIETRIPAAGVLPVLADSRALKVILDNLTSNAISYSPSPVKLRVALQPRADTVELSLMDNGQGFPKEMSENLFEAFKHPDSQLPGRRHGTGLGLYLSRRLARAMGGDLIASSPGPNLGATFTLRLLRPQKND